jgi:hypothetical protein
MDLKNVTQLQQPLTDGGIRSVNFFNGRLLSGKDLTREQTARREADARLGRAIGDGVAYGLEVSRDAALDAPAAPVLRIKAGLAVNRVGRTLRLAADVSVALTRRFGAADSGCVFASCTPLVGGTYVAGAGVYLLTIAAAETPEGRAATNGLDAAGVACNTDATVEAVQFRLIDINPLRYADLDVTSPRFRNRLAYRCFGIDARADTIIDPWRVDPPGGLIDELRAVGLDDRDVPLALVYWKADGIQFVDRWSVRRDVLVAPTLPMIELAVARGRVVGHAMFLQFEQQVDELVSPFVLPAAVTARSHFRYLPPVGVIPVAEEVAPTDAEATRFFAGLTYRGPAFINGARLAHLIRESTDYPPIDTESDEFIWLYRVRENRMAIDFRSATLQSRSFVVFASGHLPYRADAQFDLAYCNYGNYALTR